MTPCANVSATAKDLQVILPDGQSIWRTVIAIAFVLLLAVVLGFHYRTAKAELGSDLLGYDQARHYVTGVMTFDYLRYGLGSNPLKFAESYYVRYPKVTMGHWPPLYYGVQALWYFATRPSPVSLRVLSAFVSVATAVVLFRRAKVRYGWHIAFLGAILFLALPSVQIFSWDAMAEALLAFLVFLAAYALADLLKKPSLQSALWFVCWAVLAVLTKGSAWSLGLGLILAPLLAGCFRFYRSTWYWASGAGIALLGAPFYVLVSKLKLNYHVDVVAALGRQTPVSGPASLGPLTDVVPLSVLSVAVIGLGAALYSRLFKRSDDLAHTEALALAACVLSQVVFLAFLPLTFEGRYYFPSVAPLVILFLEGVRQIQLWCTAAAPRLAAAIPVAAVAATVTSVGAVQTCPAAGYRAACPGQGYSAAMAAVASRRRGPIILVASDVFGEGALVAAQLARDSARSSVVLDARQVLVSYQPSGGEYHPVKMNVGQILQFLNETPVNYVIVEEAPWTGRSGELIHQTLQDPRFDFSLRGRVPVTRAGGSETGSLLLFENRSAGDRYPTNIQVTLGPGRGLRQMQLSLSSTVSLN